ncbi:MAG: RagB/SusD family nutrient uptake outer membrane protein [Saprospiraceae bacterium]|nr:RagB/SusD family nutrient uptake outer membrane protein [Saprospiraceae bacterium]
MKNLINYIGILALAALLMIACKDEFLDGPAQGVLDESTLGNPAGVEATLVAAYSLIDGFAGFGNWGGAGSNWIFGSVASDDAYKGSEAGDQQPSTDVELYQWGTTGADGYLNSKWQNVYEGTNRANATLKLLANVDEVSADDRKRIEGEARFLRAHYQFEAWRYWENIPYYTEADEDFRKTNVGSDALVAVISDLQAAIGLLPESQSEIGRANKWTAQAYLGRVQLHGASKGKGGASFGDVKSTLDPVVSSGPYSLQDCFHTIFSVPGENSSEMVFAYQSSVNDGDGGGDNGNRNDRLNFPHGGSPFGCCGFHQPSQNLVNAYKVDGSGLPMFGTFNDADVTASDAVDPRLDWSVGRDDVPFLNHGLHAPGWIRDRAWAGPFSPKKNIYHAGQSESSNVGWNSAHLTSLNLHLLRYSDVILMLAEAEVEAGSMERARELVNMVRSRAGNCAQGPGTDVSDIAVPINDPSITWANYSVGTYDSPWADQTEARRAVRMERRLELAMEGHRFFDLRRWGIAKDVLNAYLEVEKTKRQYLTGSAGYTDRNDLYPLPSVQIELSRVDGEDRLVQNTGW